MVVVAVVVGDDLDRTIGEARCRDCTVESVQACTIAFVGAVLDHRDWRDVLGQTADSQLCRQQQGEEKHSQCWAWADALSNMTET